MSAARSLYRSLLRGAIKLENTPAYRVASSTTIDKAGNGTRAARDHHEPLVKPSGSMQEILSQTQKWQRLVFPAAGSHAEQLYWDRVRAARERKHPEVGLEQHRPDSRLRLLIRSAMERAPPHQFSLEMGFEALRALNQCVSVAVTECEWELLCRSAVDSSPTDEQAGVSSLPCLGAAPPLRSDLIMRADRVMSHIQGRAGEPVAGKGALDVLVAAVCDQLKQLHMTSSSSEGDSATRRSALLKTAQAIRQELFDRLMFQAVVPLSQVSGSSTHTSSSAVTATSLGREAGGIFDRRSASVVAAWGSGGARGYTRRIARGSAASASAVDKTDEGLLSLLGCVASSKRATPLSLTLLYHHIAQSCGVNLSLLALPAVTETVIRWVQQRATETTTSETAEAAAQRIRADIVNFPHHYLLVSQPYVAPTEDREVALESAPEVMMMGPTQHSVQCVGDSCDSASDADRRDYAPWQPGCTGKHVSRGKNSNGGEFICWSHFKNGEAEGHGTTRYTNGRNKGDVYVGQYANSRRHGAGQYSFGSGGVYTGDFHYDHMKGKGVFEWPCGTRYEGDWDHSQPSGHGTMWWSSGAQYTGDWQKGQPHGTGVCTRTNGQQISGEFAGGLKIRAVPTVLCIDVARRGMAFEVSASGLEQMMSASESSDARTVAEVIGSGRIPPQHEQMWDETQRGLQHGLSPRWFTEADVWLHTLAQLIRTYGVQEHSSALSLQHQYSKLLDTLRLRMANASRHPSATL